MTDTKDKSQEPDNLTFTLADRLKAALEEAIEAEKAKGQNK